MPLDIKAPLGEQEEGEEPTIIKKTVLRLTRQISKGRRSRGAIMMERGR